MIAVQILFIICVMLLAIPVLVFSIQILISLLPYRHQAVPSTQQPANRRPSIAILIPAHNEQHGITATLDSIRQQLEPQDRVVVIADNCSDSTAIVAHDNGAIAIERSDAVQRGKSYALDFGMRYLENNDPPEVVIIIDADCLLQAGTLTRLAHLALSRNRPVQALYLMYSPPSAGLKTKIAEFAWAVKNWARALGYHRLNLPCQLMGTGMAFPWALIQKANLASGHIVEDLKLGLDFAEQGHAPLFCPEAVVTSTFPLNNEGVKSQRTRWEHGHLAMIVKEGPALLLKSITKLNLGMFALVLDLCVPPLALLTLLVTVLSMIAIVMMLVTNALLPWLLGIPLLLLLGLAVLCAWTKFGKSILSISHLTYAPIYMLAKIPLYLRFLVKRQVEWVRSKRD
ncbi:MAG TPA: glycosyltransferase family 2 protein [Methylotenera sp.]|nr:glycosyltransferase family 2 protein [Methylotenera sp.]